MSSILDALRKFEAAEAPAAPEAAVWKEPPRRGRRTAAGVMVAFAAGVGLALWLRKTNAPQVTPTAKSATAPAPEPAEPPRPTAAPAPEVTAPRVARPAETPAAPTPVAPPATALAAAAPAPPLPAAVVEAEPPRGRVADASEPVVPPAVEVAAREPARHPEPRRAAPPDGVLARPPAGAPRVQVSFLVYSAVSARRTVALSVDGGSLVTLHEGEAAGDVEVERILADRIQVRHGGQSFTVRTRD